MEEKDTGEATRTPKQRIGHLGEAWAAWHLRRHGYRIWAKNWRNPADAREELDLVAWHDEVLIFVEVKTRALGAPVPGHAALTVRKKRALRRAGVAFMRSLPTMWRPRTTRFDLVVVEWQFGHLPFIDHYENVSLRTPRPFR